MKIVKRSAIFIAAGLQLAGCGGGGTPQTPAASTATASQVQVRFVNASPDAAYPDPLNTSIGAPLNASYALVDGTQVASIQAGPAYISSPGFNGVSVIASASSYITIPSSSNSVSYIPSAPSPGTGGTVGPFTIPTLTSGHRYTLVLAGSYCLQTLKLYAFDDGAPASAGSVAVYHVAPDAAPSYDFGFFNASDTTGATNQMAGTVTRGQRVAVPAPTLTNGFGVYVGTRRQASIGTILPSAIDSFDASNTVPYNALATFAVFITDTAQQNFGGAIVCANETFGAPNIVGTLSQ